jgi:NADPH2:quinone reductase
VESSDPALKPGDKVLAACSGLSETNDGGYSEYSRLTSNAAIKIPENITPRTAMAIGTAGFAAALAIYKMGLNNQKPDLGPIAVTGATGGVGSIAIDMLSSLGYETVAITSKKDNEEYLKNIGATSVRFFDELDIGERPLERASFGGAIDNLGGNILSWLLRSTVEEGNVASIGLALNYKLDTNVMPFILRGVNLLGVNSTTLPKTTKETVWRKISEEMMPRNIDSIVTKELTLRDLSGSFQQYLDASVVGRVIVNIDGS